MDEYIALSEAVAEALEKGAPIVALESAGTFSAFPYPKNLEIVNNLEKLITDNGAVPAMIAVLDGKICAGLDDTQKAFVAQNVKSMAKTSRRDLPVLLAKGLNGVTTVSAAMMAAQMVGIKVFATGGIGGVHRGAETTMDISADLDEFNASKVITVCSGAKAILDLKLTLEYLETIGVSVIGFRTDELPAYYTRTSGLKVDYRIDDVKEIAETFRIKEKLGIAGGLLVTNPVPEQYSLDAEALNKAIDDAVKDSVKDGVTGKEVTPYIINKIKGVLGEKANTAHEQLEYSNAVVAAEIACEL